MTFLRLSLQHRHFYQPYWHAYSTIREQQVVCQGYILVRLILQFTYATLCFTFGRHEQVCQ